MINNILKKYRCISSIVELCSFTFIFIFQYFIAFNF